MKGGPITPCSLKYCITGLQRARGVASILDQQKVDK